MAIRGICTVEGCGKPHVGKGLCRRHYSRQYRNGDLSLRKLENGAGRAFVEEAMAAQTNECIRWPYGKYPSGYGKIYDPIRRTSTGAHQYVCRLAHGERGADVEVRHSCHNKACINPNHLSWGTHSANIGDNVREGRIATGRQLPHAKLTEEDVLAIRASNETQRVLSARYGIVQSGISLIKRGKNWRHVGATKSTPEAA